MPPTIEILAAAALGAMVALFIARWWAHRRLQQMRAATTAIQQRLDTLLEGLNEAVIVIDGSGRIVAASRASYRVFPTVTDLDGRDFREALLSAELTGRIEEALVAEQGGQFDLEFDAPQPQVVTVSVRPIAGSSGAVIIAEDRTRITHLADARRDLVANVSHEIKTPLAAIRGYAETLQDGALEDPAAAAGFLDRILRQSRRLQSILDDLLTLSRIESPAAVEGREEIDLQHLLEWAADLVCDEAQQQQIDLVVADGPPCLLLGEREALERLLINLLDNAIKYNRPGGSVRAAIQSPSRQIVLEVSDTGIGIPPAALDRVFERFYRVDRARSREAGGTGLGLAIVKHAAQLHGGRVEVESRPGEGSTFRVVLPGTDEGERDTRRDGLLS